jgi:hypothetical protein
LIDAGPRKTPFVNREEAVGKRLVKISVWLQVS